MKHIRRTLAMLLVLALCLSAASFASADGLARKITVTAQLDESLREAMGDAYDQIDAMVSGSGAMIDAVVGDGVCALGTLIQFAGADLVDGVFVVDNDGIAFKNNATGEYVKYALPFGGAAAEAAPIYKPDFQALVSELTGYAMTLVSSAEMTMGSDTLLVNGVETPVSCQQITLTAQGMAAFLRQVAEGTANGSELANVLSAYAKLSAEDVAAQLNSLADSMDQGEGFVRFSLCMDENGAIVGAIVDTKDARLLTCTFGMTEDGFKGEIALANGLTITFELKLDLANGTASALLTVGDAASLSITLMQTEAGFSGSLDLMVGGVELTANLSYGSDSLHFDLTVPALGLEVVWNHVGTEAGVIGEFTASAAGMELAVNAQLSNTATAMDLIPGTVLIKFTAGDTAVSALASVFESEEVSYITVQLAEPFMGIDFGNTAVIITVSGDASVELPEGEPEMISNPQEFVQKLVPAELLGIA